MITISAIDKSLSKPARPCTEYNIFFQLERAHVLQSQLGSEPSLDGLEVFRPSQPSYVGLPPLPERYASLVLPYDWHLPGKEKRRKRKHRRTHGAIGFQQLSNTIAAAWKEVDTEIKAYCARVSEVGVVRYKIALKEWKRNGGEEQKGAAKIVKKAAKAKKANRLPKEEISKTDEPKKTAAVGQADDFDLDALLRDIQFEDDAKFDARQAPEISDVPVSIDEVHSIYAHQDERPLVEQFLAAEPDVISSINSSPMDGLADDNSGPDGEVFTKEVFQRSASIVSNEPVDMEDDEILCMWNDDDEADVVDSVHYCQEIAPARPPIAPAFDRIADVGEGAGRCKSAFGIKGYDVTMEEVCRLKKILEGQARVMEKVQRPAIRHRRRSITACCA